jgi:hypothetical protein
MSGWLVAGIATAGCVLVWIWLICTVVTVWEVPSKGSVIARIGSFRLEGGSLRRGRGQVLYSLIVMLIVPGFMLYIGLDPRFEFAIRVILLLGLLAMVVATGVVIWSVRRGNG